MINKELIDRIKNITDKFESVITTIFYDVDKETVLQTIEKKLEKVNTIKDRVKKKYLNDRIYEFREYVKQCKFDNMHYIFLVDKDIEQIELSKKDSNYLRENGIKPINIIFGKGYDTDFLTDVFLNDKYYDIIEINDKEFSYKQITKYKTKQLMNANVKKIDDILPENKVLYHGVSSVLKSMKGNLVYNKRLNRDEQLKKLRDDDMIENHKYLDQLFADFNNPKKQHRIKIGKDLIKSINRMLIQTLFYHESKKDKLFDTFDNDKLNFELVEIGKLEHGDISDTLLKDYSGFVGRSYY